MMNDCYRKWSRSLLHYDDVSFGRLLLPTDKYAIEGNPLEVTCWLKCLIDKKEILNQNNVVDTR